MLWTHSEMLQKCKQFYFCEVSFSRNNVREGPKLKRCPKSYIPMFSLPKGNYISVKLIFSQVRYCETIGIPPTQSSKLYIYSGVTSLLIRPVIGRLCDVKWIEAHVLFQIAAVLEGIASLLLPLATKNLYLVLYFILYGCTDGAMGSAMCVVVMFCFKGAKRVRGFGLFQSITNIVSAFGPALGGTSDS